MTGELYPQYYEVFDDLKRINQGVEKMYARGNQRLIELPKVAVIGARKATHSGIAASDLVGKVAAEAGVCVVSGGAWGCDAAASRSALKHGGTTIVASGCGIERIYPASSREIYEASDRGDSVLILSEYPGDTPPAKWTFPRRNRLIAALAPVLVIAEASLKSGTLSTAASALELNRSVYVFPGSIFNPAASGSNRLLEDGAHIICDEESLRLCFARELGVLNLQNRTDRSASYAHLSPLQQALLEEPLSVEELSLKVSLPFSEVLSQLTLGEAEGVLEKRFDGRYSLSAAAYQAR